MTDVKITFKENKKAVVENKRLNVCRIHNVSINWRVLLKHYIGKS